LRQNYCKKGALVGTTGRIQTRNYDNQQGQRIYVTEIIAENFQMLESRSVSEARDGNSKNADNYQNQNHEDLPMPEEFNEEDIRDSDIPYYGQ
jgi:single-strand DNA-binding protein